MAYDAGVVVEHVDALVPDDAGDLVLRPAAGGRVGDVDLHDMEGALRCGVVLEGLERGRFVGVTARCHDEIGGILQEAGSERETEATGGSEEEQESALTGIQSQTRENVPRDQIGGSLGHRVRACCV